MHPLFWAVANWVVGAANNQIDNMEGATTRQCRLGLDEIPAMLQYTENGVYGHLEKTPEVQQQKLPIEQNTEHKCTIEQKILRVTELGKQFASVCVLRK